MTSRKINVEDKKASNVYSRIDIVKAMTEFLEEALPQVGRPLNMKWSNIRLTLMFAACAASLYGQFGTKFPGDSFQLGLCVVGYFLLSGIVTLMDYTVLRDTSFVIKDKQGDIFAGVALRPGESHLTLTLRSETAREEYKISTEKVFDEEGNLLQSSALSTLEGHLASFTKRVSDKKRQ